jgi:hypothetical protein
VEWLTRWWGVLLRDLVLTGGGLAVIGSQVALAYLPDGHPNPYLIGAGLSLTLPSTYAKLREVMRTVDPPGTDGSPGSSSLPHGPEPSPLSSPLSSTGNGGE